jgi:Na+/melibiose symporter-like transporter
MCRDRIKGVVILSILIPPLAGLLGGRAARSYPGTGVACSFFLPASGVQCAVLWRVRAAPVPQKIKPPQRLAASGGVLLSHQSQCRASRFV